MQNTQTYDRYSSVGDCQSNGSWCKYFQVLGVAVSAAWMFYELLVIVVTTDEAEGLIFSKT